MRRLLLTTASIIAITCGGGLAFAAGSSMAPSGTNSGTSASHSSGAMNGTQSQGMLSGTSQAEVKQAQQQLKSEGLYNGQIDGVVGPETKQAVSQYQKKEGLRQTARLDQETLSHLLGNQTSGSGSSSTPSQQSPTSGQSGSSMGSSPQHSSPSGGSSGSSSSGGTTQ